MQTLPEYPFTEDAYLNLTRFAIFVARFLEEEEHDIRGAYDVLREAQAAIWERAGAKERMRAAAIAMKLVDLADALGMGADAKEHWLTAAVEHVLRPPRDHGSPDRAVDSGPEPITHLPVEGFDEVDVCVPLEALGTFYANAGKAE